MSSWSELQIPNPQNMGIGGSGLQYQTPTINQLQEIGSTTQTSTPQGAPMYGNQTMSNVSIL